MKIADDTLERSVTTTRSMRVIAGCIILAGAGLVLFVSIALLVSVFATPADDNGAVIGATALGLSCIVLTFIYIGVRLIRVRTDTEKLFSPRGTKIAGVVLITVGIVAAVYGVVMLVRAPSSSNLQIIVSGGVLYALGRACLRTAG